MKDDSCHSRRMMLTNPSDRSPVTHPQVRKAGDLQAPASVKAKGQRQPPADSLWRSVRVYRSIDPPPQVSGDSATSLVQYRYTTSETLLWEILFPEPVPWARHTAPPEALGCADRTMANYRRIVIAVSSKKISYVTAELVLTIPLGHNILPHKHLLPP